MKSTLLIAALLLSGCATTRPAGLENRVACTVGGAQAYVVSLWQVFGISTRISDDDAKVICRP